MHSLKNLDPFFLQELLLHLVESNGLSVSGDEWILTDSSVELSTPESLTGLLQSTLDRLPETLLNCSVFGMDFSCDLYRKAVNKLGLEPSDRDVFDDLVERQLLEKNITDSRVSYVFTTHLFKALPTTVFCLTFLYFSTQQ
jgi:predicted ATPase